MCAPISHASPSRTWAYACCSDAPPSRSDFTSVPVSTIPASYRSRRWYSCRALRFSVIGLTATFPRLDRSDFHLAARALDSLDAHGDRVSEPERPAAAAARERGAERRDLEVVAWESARRQERLEDVLEAHEEARADQADDF